MLQMSYTEFVENTPALMDERTDGWMDQMDHRPNRTRCRRVGVGCVPVVHWEEEGSYEELF